MENVYIKALNGMTVILGDQDCDIVIQFPGMERKQMIIQVRPSNADENYNGSLDIVLPEPLPVVCFSDDDLTEAKGNDFVKQIMTDLPGDYT